MLPRPAGVPGATQIFADRPLRHPGRRRHAACPPGPVLGCPGGPDSVPRCPERAPRWTGLGAQVHGTMQVVHATPTTPPARWSIELSLSSSTSTRLGAAARLQAPPPALQEVGRLPRALGTHGSSAPGRIREARRGLVAKDERLQGLGSPRRTASSSRDRESSASLDQSACARTPQRAPPAAPSDLTRAAAPPSVVRWRVG